MKKLFILMLLLITVGVTINAQSFTREGNTFISSTGERTNSTPVKTKFTWKDSKGKEYPVYISPKGSCFVIKGIKPNGKEDRRYLGKEISQQICKELGIEYKVKERVKK